MLFGKPQMWMKVGYDGKNSQRAHLSIWVQAYGAQPARTHTILVIGNMTNKQEQAKQWHGRPLRLGPRSMERPSA